jgi:PH (Pleckstrin Homology) domain-containing protein
MIYTGGQSGSDTEGTFIVSQPETTVGVYRASKWRGAFWLRTIFTLGFYYFLVYRFNSITLTNRRVTQRRGNILTSNEASVAIDGITDVIVNKSALGSLLNYGDIIIQAPGGTMNEISFVGLANASKVRELIFDLKDGSLDKAKNQ